MGSSLALIAILGSRMILMLRALRGKRIRRFIVGFATRRQRKSTSRVFTLS
jgi:hypothetical protein